MCNCKRFPGKFEGEGPLTFVVYEMLLNGCTSSVDALDVVPAAYLTDLDAEMIEALSGEGYCPECIADAQAEAASEAGSFYCIEETDQGFVNGAWQTQAELDQIEADMGDLESDDE